jgi:hypothetical protein
MNKFRLATWATLPLASGVILVLATNANAQSRYRYSVVQQPAPRVFVRPMPQSTPMMVQQRAPVVRPFVQNRVVPYAQNQAINYARNYSALGSATKGVIQQAAARGFQIIGWDVAGRVLVRNPYTGAAAILFTPNVVE